MGFCLIQNLVLAFWFVTGSISTLSPEIPVRPRGGQRQKPQEVAGVSDFSFVMCPALYITQWRDTGSFSGVRGRPRAEDRPKDTQMAHGSCPVGLLEWVR